MTRNEFIQALYISQANFTKFALRTVAVAATATVSDVRCSLEDGWHIKSVKMHDVAGLRVGLSVGYNFTSRTSTLLNMQSCCRMSLSQQMHEDFHSCLILDYTERPLAGVPRSNNA